MAPTTVDKYVRYATIVLWMMAGGWMAAATAGDWRALSRAVRSSPPELSPLLATGLGWLIVGVALSVWHIRATGSARELARLRAMQSRQRASARMASAERPVARRRSAAVFGELEDRTESTPAIGTLSRRPGD